MPVSRVLPVCLIDAMLVLMMLNNICACCDIPWYSLIIDGEGSNDDDYYSGEFLYTATLVGCDLLGVSCTFLFNKCMISDIISYTDVRDCLCLRLGHG